VSHSSLYSCVYGLKLLPVFSVAFSSFPHSSLLCSSLCFWTPVCAVPHAWVTLRGMCPASRCYHWHTAHNYSRISWHFTSELVGPDLLSRSSVPYDRKSSLLDMELKGHESSVTYAHFVYCTAKYSPHREMCDIKDIWYLEFASCNIFCHMAYFYFFIIIFRVQGRFNAPSDSIGYWLVLE
jgi:hypothetical protein